MTPDALRAVMAHTGLTESTCAELLEKGWQYVEGIETVPRWEHPMRALKVDPENMERTR